MSFVKQYLPLNKVEDRKTTSYGFPILWYLRTAEGKKGGGRFAHVVVVGFKENSFFKDQDA